MGQISGWRRLSEDFSQCFFKERTGEYRLVFSCTYVGITGIGVAVRGVSKEVGGGLASWSQDHYDRITGVKSTGFYWSCVSSCWVYVHEFYDKLTSEYMSIYTLAPF